MAAVNGTNSTDSPATAIELEHIEPAQKVATTDDGLPKSETVGVDVDQNLIKRIDLILMPMLAVSYLFQYLDKSSIANSSVMGLIPDLELHGQQYPWLGSIFYIGYLVASYPVSIILVRFHLGKALAVSIVAWGAVLGCHAAANNWTQMMALRALLGAFESTIAPGFTLITSIWYRKSEHAARHGVWYAGNAVGAIIGALLAYGLAHDSGKVLDPWRALFILLGALTVLWGAFLFMTLPDSPLNSRFLNAEEQRRIHDRVQSQQKTTKTNKWQLYQFLEALRDPKVLILFVFNISLSMINGIVSNFSSIIISSFGFDSLTTLLLNMPLYAVQFIVIIVSTVLVQRFRKSRIYVCIAGDVIALIGVVLIRQLPFANKGGRLCGILLVMAFSNNFFLALSLISSNVGGFTKRSTTSALFFIAYCAGNLAGPQLVISSEAPHYTSAFTGMLVIMVANVVLLLLLRVYLDQMNKKRDREQGFQLDPEARGIDGYDGEYAVSEEQADQTDWENKQFRYTL